MWFEYRVISLQSGQSVQRVKVQITECRICTYTQRRMCVLRSCAGGIGQEETRDQSPSGHRHPVGIMQVTNTRGRLLKKKEENYPKFT